MTGLPPSLTGAVHDTVAEAFPATPETAVGAPGTVGAALERLPARRSFHTVYDLWAALSGATERAPAGRRYPDERA